jgi:hypothetical protein
MSQLNLESRAWDKEYVHTYIDRYTHTYYVPWVWSWLKMTGGCGISYKTQNMCAVPLKLSHKKNNTDIHRIHIRYFGAFNRSTHTSVLSTYAIYTNV